MNSNTWIACMLAALAMFCGSVLNPCRAGTSGQSYNDVVVALRAASSQLLNLHVEFQYWEERETTDATWERTHQYRSGTAWFNGLPGSKARISYSKYVVPWIDGKGDYLDRAFDIGFNGQQSRVVIHESGPFGGRSAFREATIARNRPVYLEEGAARSATGLRFSSQFYSPTTGKSFADALEDFDKAGGKTLIATEQLGDVAAIRLTLLTKNNTKFIYWFDPGRGYALLKYQLAVNDSVQEEARITQITEAAPGVWFPTEAYFELETKDVEAARLNRPSRHRIRQQYRASRVVANDSNFDDRIFTVPIPDGYDVIDEVRGLSFKVGPGDEVLESRLDEVVREAQAQLSPEEARLVPRDRTAIVSSQPAAAAGTHYGPAAWKWGTLVVVVGACLLIGGVLARLWRRRTGVQLFIVGCLSLTAHQGAAAQTTQSILPTSPETDCHIRFNCGLNVTYVTLKMFGRSCSVTDVARMLSVGADHERYSTLADIKQAANAQGLDAAGYRADTLSEVVDEARSDRILIVKLQTSDALGHFVLLLGGGDDIVLVDPPLRPIRLRRDVAKKDKYLSQATGEFLVVHRRSGSVRKGPVLQLNSANVDLGEIPVALDEFGARVECMNVGTETLKVDAKGSCGCFIGFDGSREIAPGGSTVLQLRFSRKKLSEGPSQRIILLQTNDAEQKDVPIRVKFSIRRIPTVKDIIVDPAQIDYGRTTSAQITTSIPITVTLPVEPPGNSGDIGKVDVSCTHPGLKVVLVKEEWRTDRSTTPVAYDRTYSLSWTAPPEGRFRENVLFRIRPIRGEPLDVKIPVDGEIAMR